jgi:hypothetical protein
MGPEVVVEPRPVDVGPIETARVRARRRVVRLGELATAPARWWWRLMIRYLGSGGVVG